MCVLRATGDQFDVDAFLAASTLLPCRIFRRGEPRGPTSRPDGLLHTFSGITVPVSDADWSDLPAQVDDAERFLRAYAAEIRRLLRFPGVEALTLDFPILLRIGPEVVAQSDRFPASLVARAGRLHLGLEISVYDGPGFDKAQQ